MAAATMNTEQARFNMIQQQIRPWEVLDPEVLGLLAIVKREDFAPAAHKDLAFADVEVPLKKDAKPSQTMLAPRIEARMLQALGIRNTDKVLEIGTGSGYQAAILSLLCRRVYTVDRHRRLVTEAEAIFRHFGLSNITAMVSDGSRGLPDQAPFDRIMVTAAAEDPPGPLLAQLKIGGIMVVPVGQSDAVQTLIRVRRGENGFDYDELRQVRFVPLVEGLGQT